MKVSKSLNLNMLYIEKCFADCGDVVKRLLPIGTDEQIDTYIVYIDQLTDSDMIDEAIVRKMMANPELIKRQKDNYSFNILETIKNNGITKVDLTEQNDFDNVLQAILSGDTAFFVDGYENALIISTKGFPNRGVPQTESEVVVQGSKEAFSEVFRINTALIRRRIRDTNLKVHQLVLGQRSKTDTAVMYMDDIVRKDILDEVLSRLDKIDIDAILDIGYVEQLIEDDYLSPFPQMQVTERPDKAAASILEGRIAIIVDNSPYALIIPSTLNCFFQASEDYYQRWAIMSYTRLLRFIAAFFSICIPGLFIALNDYHPSMLPLELVLKMAEAGKNVPFPTVMEVLIMDIAYELLKEAGTRLPGPVGSTMGIVGGLIVGQAAVDAGIVSPVVVIITALTAISNFAVPNHSLVNGFRLSKYMIIFTSAILGILGFWLGLFLVLAHLVSMKSFGIPYMYPYTSGDVNNNNDFKDTLLRYPIFKMKYRPIFANPKQTIRMNNQKGDKTKEEQ